MLSKILSNIPALCRGDAQLIDHWMDQSPAKILGYTLPFIIIGCASYGLSMGLWQGWTMASYAAIKFPLVVIATLLLNGLINGMLAMVLDSNISFKQSLQFLFTAFALCALILGSLSPITIGMALQGPVVLGEEAKQFHRITLLTHVLMISFAGIVSHNILLKSLIRHAKSLKAANKTFVAWLLGNLFVGAQIGWISRPFFGSPGNDIQFLRENKFESSFYESIYNSISNLF